MSLTDWDEIKRLAADFQRAQLSSAVQRLSEINCIEIINKLLAQNLLEVVFTTDGKEYITPEHLVKEIKDELYVSGGRINFVELAKILSVDYNVIAAKAAEIEKSDPLVHIINGQLINQTFINTISEEINERLQCDGLISIGDLTSDYDLPSEFLIHIFDKQLGKRIFGIQDKTDQQAFYTESFVESNLCLLRGALTALTKPTPVSTLINLCGGQERLFNSLIESLQERRELSGCVSGKQSSNSLYVPAIYSKNQNDYVDNFYKQNGYIEYSTLTRLGISEPQVFVKKHFKQDKLLLLPTCAVGNDLLSRVEAAVDDVITSCSFINTTTILPSCIDDESIETLLHEILKHKSSSINLQIFCSCFLFSDTYLSDVVKSFNDLLDSKAKLCVSSGEFMKFLNKNQLSGGGGGNRIVDEEKSDSRFDKKEERRKKAAGGKVGGGTQGRETKTKSTKKKYMKNKQNVDDSDEEFTNRKNATSHKLELISLSEIKKIIEKIEGIKEEENDDLVTELATHVKPVLCKIGLELAQKYYEASLTSDTGNKRKSHSELQDKLNSMIMNVKLFEKGYKQVENTDVQEQLEKYLLKSLCTETANEVFIYVSSDLGKKYEGNKELTIEERVKIINSVGNDMKEPLLKLHKSLNSSVDEFLTCIEAAIGPGLCDMIVKKTDKKREKQEILNHRQQLMEQLSKCEDPALVLHLTTLILFQLTTQNILHASGRFVSNILTTIQKQLNVETYELLQIYHDSVLKLLTTKDEEEKSKVKNLLEAEMNAIKNIALNFKKSNEKQLKQTSEQ